MKLPNSIFYSNDNVTPSPFITSLRLLNRCDLDSGASNISVIRLLNKLAKFQKEYEEAKMKIFKKLGTQNPENPDTWEIPKGKLEDYVKELNELLAIENDYEFTPIQTPKKGFRYPEHDEETKKTTWVAMNNEELLPIAQLIDELAEKEEMEETPKKKSKKK